MLNNMKQTLKNEDQIINKRIEQFSNICDIIDPDKFPIFSLVDKLSNYELESVWNYRPDLYEQLI